MYLLVLFQTSMTLFFFHGTEKQMFRKTSGTDDLGHHSLSLQLLVHLNTSWASAQPMAWVWGPPDQWQMGGVFSEITHVLFNFIDLSPPPSSQRRDTYMITLTGAGGAGQRGRGGGGRRLRPTCGRPRDVTHLTTITSGLLLGKAQAGGNSTNGDGIYAGWIFGNGLKIPPTQRCVEKLWKR